MFVRVYQFSFPHPRSRYCYIKHFFIHLHYIIYSHNDIAVTIWLNSQYVKLNMSVQQSMHLCVCSYVQVPVQVLLYKHFLIHLQTYLTFIHTMTLLLLFWLYSQYVKLNVSVQQSKHLCVCLCVPVLTSSSKVQVMLF